MKVLGFLIVAALLGGCAPLQVKPVSMEKDYLNSGSKKVGVALAEMPASDIYFPGANCLLCVGVAEMANSTLGGYAETLMPDDLLKVKGEIVQRLKDKGVDAVAIDEIIDAEKLPEFKSNIEGVAQYDHSIYGEKYDITQLVVIDINLIGMERKYASYVPTGDPEAIVYGVGYLVELSTNKYKWYKNIAVNKSASGEWDEPPHFPALTNAYYQVIAESRENILAEF